MMPQITLRALVYSDGGSVSDSLYHHGQACEACFCSWPDNREIYYRTHSITLFAAGRLAG